MCCIMYRLVVIIAIVIAAMSCGNEYENPPFVVAQVGSEYFSIPGKIAYISYENNAYVDDSFKYEVGDTIPNAINYVIK